MPVNPRSKPVDLDEQKFTHLNDLLNQTTIYSQFLSEQMEGLDEEKHAERPRKKQKKKQGDAPGASRRKGGDGGGANADGD